MISHLIWLKISILSFLLLSILYVHFRGKVRLTLFRQIVDHSALMAPYNVLMYLFSSVPRKPILNTEYIPEVAVLRDNWETLRQEGLRLLERGDIKSAAKNNDIGFNSFFKEGWTRFYVKWYDEILPSARTLCPNTVSLVEGISRIRAVMFVVLPGGSHLNPHRDPFAGSLRYHLGLATPNSDACRLVVDDEIYSWRDGKDVLFDETYIHSVQNGTDQARLILFCDVDRPLKGGAMRILNRSVGTILGRATATQNVEGEKVGALSRLYNLIHTIDEKRKRLKRYNKTAYRFTKFLIIGMILGALILM